MPTLSAYSNTENTALIILKQLGYRYWLEDKGTEYEKACCEKDGWDFKANTFTYRG